MPALSQIPSGSAYSESGSAWLHVAWRCCWRHVLAVCREPYEAGPGHGGRAQRKWSVWEAPCCHIVFQAGHEKRKVSHNRARPCIGDRSWYVFHLERNAVVRIDIHQVVTRPRAARVDPCSHVIRRAQFRDHLANRHQWAFFNWSEPFEPHVAPLSRTPMRRVNDRSVTSFQRYLEVGDRATGRKLILRIDAQLIVGETPVPFARIRRRGGFCGRVHCGCHGNIVDRRGTRQNAIPARPWTSGACQPCASVCSQFGGGHRRGRLARPCRLTSREDQKRHQE